MSTPPGGDSATPRTRSTPLGTVFHMSAGMRDLFGPEYERLVAAAQRVGVPVEQYVRDAVLGATRDPFVEALEHAAARAVELAPEEVTPPAGSRPAQAASSTDDIGSPMSSSTLRTLNAA